MASEWQSWDLNQTVRSDRSSLLAARGESGLCPYIRKRRLFSFVRFFVVVLLLNDENPSWKSASQSSLSPLLSA